MASVATMAVVLSPFASSLAAIPARVKSLDLNEFKPRPVEITLFNKELLTTYLPKNLKPTRDASKLQTQIQNDVGQKVIDSFFNGEFFKKTSVGRLTHRVQEAAQQSVTLGQTNEGIEQKVDFQLRAMERQAVVRYQGTLHSNLTFQMDTNTLSLAVSKPLGKATTLSLTNAMPLGANSTAGSINLTYLF